MMAPYHYLNKLFVDKFSSGSKRKRSASVTISQVTCNDCPASSNSIINLRNNNNNNNNNNQNNQNNQNNNQINRDNKQQQQQQQLAAANKENLEPDDESAAACLTFKRRAGLEETSNSKEGEVEEAEEEEHQEQQRLKRKVLTSNDLTNTLKSTCSSSSRRLIMIQKQQQQQQQTFHNQHYRQAAVNQLKSRRNHLLRSKQLQQRQQQCKSGATYNNKTLFAILDNNMSCPTILYLAALVAVVVMFSSHTLHQIDCATLGPEANGTYLSQPQSSSFSLFNRENSRSPPMTFPPVLSSIDWHRIGSSLQKQLESIRWTSPHASRIGAGSSSGGGGVGGGSGGGGGTRDPARLSPLRRRPSPLVRAFDRIRSQMGARNTIRVHNAFRDFAWRVLSSLSMPTPVIYELRRQNFYSPEEDLINDNFYNRNTSRTIRSKRLIDPAKVSNWLSTTTQHALRAAGRADSLNAGAAGAAVQKTHRSRRRRRRSASDDDDEPETLRERLRMRLDDLLSLSRRSLFGRVVRLPSLFPFKRQEDEDDSDSDDRSDKATAQLAVAAAAVAKSTTGATSKGAKQRQLTSGGGGGGGGSSKRQSGIRLLTMAGRSGRKRKEADRQMISINGKQYYVDDDGELKEWTEQT